MKSNFGYYISKIQVSGSNMLPAELEFSPGFNVVSGLSNTGKSYAFACINYMLGGKQPKKIPVSENYFDYFLEIKTYDGKTYTLFRNINDTNYSLKECEIKKFFSTEKVTHLKPKQSTNDENVSTFLLNICGFANLKVKVNSLNKTRNLSFRDVIKYIMVDEERIITEKSPIFSGQYAQVSVEQSIFNLILTGDDEKELPLIEEPKMFTSRINGQIEFVNSMIENLSDRINNISNSKMNFEPEKINSKLEILKSELLNTTLELESMLNIKREIVNNIEEFSSKKIFQNELIDRFILLKEHYENDLKRLEFITEGENYFRQLSSVLCPLCGGSMDNKHYECLIENENKNVNIIESIEVEVQKIKSKLKDLESTTNEALSEKNFLIGKINKLEEEFKIIEKEIKEKLEPMKLITNSEIDELLKVHAYINEKNLLSNELTKYYEQKNQLVSKLKNKPKPKKEFVETNYEVMKEFCIIIEEMLKKWKYNNLSTVNFNTDPKIYDIDINGIARSANGKGIRAITYSSFVIALMNYCIKFKLPHPKNILLDSPLTSYRGGNLQLKNEEVNKDMQNSFFEDLSNLEKDRQLIIFDNKEPPKDLIPKINYIHFTGHKNNGRYGFFPISEKK